jgi:flagellin-like hook-associated protein FlgL
MQEVSLPAASRSALLALSSIQNDMGKLQKRLASGKRVSSPIDNPTAYFLAQSLTSRAASLSGLTDSISSAQSTIAAANAGITAIQSLLTSAQSLANSALQSTVSTVTVTGTNSSALTTGSIIASNAGSATRFKAGDVVTVSDGTTTATYTAVNNDTVQTFLNAVNNTAGLKVTASLNSSGQIQLATTAAANVTIGATVNGAGGGTLNGIIGLTAGTTNYTVNSTRSSYATQFNSLRTQIDAVVQDSGFNGVNLLSGSSLNVTFNENGSSSLTVAGVTVTSAGLSVAASTNNWQNDTDINAAVTALSNAVSSLQETSVALSSMTAVMSARSDFNKAMVDTLNSGADEIVGTDVNEDSALLLALQTRQQVAITALSFTQGANSTALKLFGLSG